MKKCILIFAMFMTFSNVCKAEFVDKRFNRKLMYNGKDPYIVKLSENQIYTVFEIPTLERYPSATDRLKGQGYIYGVGWDVNIWAALTDTPLPAEMIEMIRLNIKEEAEERFRRYIITK